MLTQACSACAAERFIIFLLDDNDPEANVKMFQQMFPFFFFFNFFSFLW